MKFIASFLGFFSGSTLGIFLSKNLSKDFLLNFLATFLGVIIATILSWCLYKIQQHNKKEKQKEIIKKDLIDKKETIESLKDKTKEIIEDMQKTTTFINKIENSKEEKIKENKKVITEVNKIMHNIFEFKIQIAAYLDSTTLKSIIYLGHADIFSEKIIKAYQGIEICKNQIMFISKIVEKDINYGKKPKRMIKTYKDYSENIITQTKKTKKLCEKALREID